MPITVKLANGTQHSVDVSDFGVTVSELKKQMSGTLDIPAEEQRVILRGKVLKDDCVLSAVGMEDGSVIHVVRSKKAAVPAPVAQPATASTPSPSQTSSAPSQPLQAEVPANPYAALMSTFGAAQRQLPADGVNTFSAVSNPYASMGMGMGMDGAGNLSPQPVIEMMQNPMMQQFLQQALDDPQFTQYVIQSSPELARLPPEQLQDVIQMMRNPFMMQQAMAMMGGGAAGGVGMPNLVQPANQQSSNAVAPMAGFNPAMFAPPPPQGNPREIYREQLQQLREMGFPNEEANIAALQQAQGNVQFALERLLGA
ncbi:putative Ubiquitin-like protein [Leptomonas seymouri]|uniref:Putative Ubiquitin-like protein n=1 Tax=Leptomonas seymouri TaxID=5684 RepID=A0A0N1I781_LEPSE|nr:putative Ubiquitin-like protein [Leptomonas seymouri]|eukprot:KPI88188.1 putative Ubiquitin-like protein [Leptomonas seymouri]